MIKWFLEGVAEAQLITYPRRWGKSINLSMLEYFFGLELDENGVELPEEMKRNHLLFTGGEIDLR